MPKKASGEGTIRKKTVTRNGKEYTYWEARLTTGRDPGTGKQLQRSFTGSTQKEVREKLQAAAVAVNTGTYIAPSKMTLGEWLDIWLTDYLTGRKSRTVAGYTSIVNRRIRPALGALKLSELQPHHIQKFINDIREELSPISVRNVHTVLQTALQKAVQLRYIPSNPAKGCELPKKEQKGINPLDDDQVTALLQAISGTETENIITVALFTGLRISELCGLTWDCVDFRQGTITVNKQLSTGKDRPTNLFGSPKSGKTRTITPARSVMQTLQKQRDIQIGQQLRAGSLWHNPHGFVFTQPDGCYYDQFHLLRVFQKVARSCGLDDVRFHDLRHTYAVNSLRAGDDIKTVQTNLGHATAAFTLDRYGHVTDRMKTDSAQRMDKFMQNVLNL